MNDTELAEAIRAALHETRVTYCDFHGLAESKAREMEWCAHCDIVAQRTVARLGELS